MYMKPSSFPWIGGFFGITSLLMNTVCTAAPQPEKFRECPGTLYRNCVHVGQKYEIGTAVPYHLYVPGNMPKEGGAFYVLTEFNPEDIVESFEQYIHDEIVPPGLLIIVHPGTLHPTLPGGASRYMRAEELDHNGPEFVNLIADELRPEAEQIAGVTLSRSPDMGMIGGGSSGGMLAWNGVWYRNDVFRRAYLCSPTFSAMRGGEEPMVLVRKTETRPIRMYVTCGTKEPDYFFGNSFYAACNAHIAFEFAKYDAKFENFPGMGHSPYYRDGKVIYRIMEFLWKNWKTDLPVRPLGNQIRIQNLLTEGSVWEECPGPMPAKPTAIKTSVGEYTHDATRILLKKGDGSISPVAEGLDEISSLALSSDGWRLYVGDSRRRFVFAYAINPDGSLGSQYKLASLHLAHDCRFIGAKDICCSAQDRAFAATELGIQGIVSFGLTDLILPLPQDLPADRVALVDNMLYAASGNRIFRRPVKVTQQKEGEIKPPATPAYGDGGDYSRPHLPQN